jgi:hypothetical protein
MWAAFLVDIGGVLFWIPLLVPSYVATTIVYATEFARRVSNQAQKAGVHRRERKLAGVVPRAVRLAQ